MLNYAVTLIGLGTKINERHGKFLCLRKITCFYKFYWRYFKSWDMYLYPVVWGVKNIAKVFSACYMRQLNGSSEYVSVATTGEWLGQYTTLRGKYILLGVEVPTV